MSTKEIPLNTDQTLDNNHRGAQCENCGEGFTPGEWENRHDFHDCERGCMCGGYVHYECCRACNDGETQGRRRGHSFYPIDVEFPEHYATEGVRLTEKVILAHYFVGGCDWWLVEYDADERIGWGYACLGDPGCAEWGYVSLTELEAVTVQGVWVVERDLHWTPVAVKAARLPGRPM